jgi:hypothetical protein
MAEAHGQHVADIARQLKFEIFMRHILCEYPGSLLTAQVIVPLSACALFPQHSS